METEPQGFTAEQTVYLERPHIDKLLENAVKRPLVTIIAGAGYGKTSSVHAFMGRQTARLGWIQFSSRDNDGELFWENFSNSVRLVDTRTSKSLSDLEFPDTERRFESFLRVCQRYINPAEHYIFVFDDCHLLSDRNMLLFLERAITAPFPNVTSILVSRNELPLRLIGFESKGLLAKITEEDLRFNRDEMIRYFHLQGLAPSEPAIESIYRDTEGWAFAIYLAGRALRHTGKPDAESLLSSSAEYVPRSIRGNIFALIEEEVLNTITPPLRRFLLRLSLLDHLQDDLLLELGSPELVELINRMGSFVSFDPYTSTYHIHPLFLEYLRGLNELGEDEKKEVYRASGRWCAANNQKMRALTYFEKAGDYDALIRTARSLPMMLPGKIARALIEIVDRAPESAWQNPFTHIVRVRCLIALCRFEEAGACLWKIIGRYETAALDDPGIGYLLGVCHINLGFLGFVTCLADGNFDFADHFKRGKEYMAASKLQTPWPFSVFPVSSYAARTGKNIKGEMEKFHAVCVQVEEYVFASMNGCAAGFEALVASEIAFFRGDHAAAVEAALKSVTKARAADQAEIESHALFYLLRIALGRGNSATVSDILRQIEAQMERQHYANRIANYDIIRGWFYIQTGQYGKTPAWLRNDFAESDVNQFLYALEILVKAKYHMAMREYPQAIAMLSSEDRFGPASYAMGRVEAKAMEAVCRYRMDEKESAYAVLEEAWKLAEPNGFFMPFTELGRDMRLLADSALEEGCQKLPREVLDHLRFSASAYTKRLLIVMKDRGNEAPDHKTAEDLSRRELETLAGLAQGLTGEEVAADLNLSINTVKSVIKRVYNKLGALNKADAVRIADNLGLLPRNH
ncbi:MAG: LuxR C-terminal-related transcriptional regulator [Treponema sp.]|jgi:LuxR family maltose regulon positive regulatory protein|nr:LuxR C-terminal-related transcriptional regulator [Treponema sp.]